MSIKSLKFTPADFVGNDISSLPDDPSSAGYTAAELKGRFDRIAKNMLALGRFNELIELLANEGAANVGASAAGFDASTVQGVIDALIDKLTGSEGAAFVGTAQGGLQAVLDAMNNEIENKQPSIEVDSEPVAGSENPVTSGGVKKALDEKADKSDTLLKGNKEAYSPSLPYEPATKKYVDDYVISAAKGNTASVGIVIPAGRMKGDVDGDGFITEADVSLIELDAKNTIALEGVQLWCADITSDNRVLTNDKNAVKNYINGSNPSTLMSKFADYNEKWAFEAVDDAHGLWHTVIEVGGVTELSDALIVIAKGCLQAGFVKAECLEGAIKIYAKACPVEDVSAAVFFGPGNGTAVIKTQESEPETAIKSITLGTEWTKNTGFYTQSVSVAGITESSRVDIQPDAMAIAALMDAGTTALYIANDAGALTAYAVGAAPSVELLMQASVTEVKA